ncbi:hypothetical protein BCEP4_680077 [Burkholderia cepacia]|nr:hypothetical protein BCEP4_680077 [Burkholderia cepacia]
MAGRRTPAGRARACAAVRGCAQYGARGDPAARRARAAAEPARCRRLRDGPVARRHRVAVGATGRRSPRAARRHPRIPARARRRDRVFRRAARRRARPAPDPCAAARARNRARERRGGRRSRDRREAARGNRARVAQHDVPAPAYERDRDAARAHLDQRGGHDDARRARVRTPAAAAPRRVRRDLRATARRGAHRDADPYRLRAQPFRAQRRRGLRLVGLLRCEARPAGTFGAAGLDASHACARPGFEAVGAARAIDRFIGRLLESAGTARQPRAAAHAGPVFRQSRKSSCSRP